LSALRRTALVPILCGALATTAAPEAPALARGSDALAQGFAAPPPAARARIWWHWINGNVTAAGITADLEAMARAGLGGFQLLRRRSEAA
jgi:hypothetical protein